MRYKTLHFVLVFLISSIYTNAQTCASLHTGKFRLRDKENVVSIITRNEKYQTEVNPDFNLVFSITWVNECVYELRPVKVIKGDASLLEQGIIVTVEIVEIKKHGYKAFCTTNISEETNTFIIERLE